MGIQAALGRILPQAADIARRSFRLKIVLKSMTSVADFIL